MSVALSLLRIEGRRNLGLWLFPLMAALGFWVASPELFPRAVLWPSVSTQVQYSVLLLGPLTGGLSAWMAGRNRRHAVLHQLKTTAYSPARRDLTLLAATVGWACLAYLAAAFVVLGIASQRATWGMPHWSPLLIGLLGVVGNGTVGYATGHYVASRFVAPLTAVVLLWIHLALSALPGGALHLSPIGGAYASDFLVFFQAPSAAMPQALWLLGLTTAAVAVIGLKSQPSPIIAGILLASMAVAVGAAVTLVRSDPYTGYVQLEPRPFEHVCAHSASGFTVCVHPAFAETLPENTEVLGELAAPFTGISGGVVRMEQTHGYAGLERLDTDGTLAFILPLGRTNVDYLAYTVSGVLAGVQGTPQNDAQGAIWVWMLQRIGLDFRDLHFEENPDRESHWLAGAERFAALGDELRSAWLEENYEALRAGELTLEDLP